MAKKQSRDVVAEIAASIQAKRNGFAPWWERIVPEEHRETVEAIHAAWHGGILGGSKAPAARAIAQKLAELGINIGNQGVIAWLNVPPKS